MRFEASRPGSGFSRLELLASCAALALLSALAFPLFAATRADSDRAGCFNNLRQLISAALQYADEHNDAFPPRQLPPFWPARLTNYFSSTNILVCPADGPSPRSFGVTPVDGSPRSYVMNGWNDYFYAHYGQFISTNAMPLSGILEPSQTIVFGEKLTESGHFWLDYSEFDDFLELDQGRHYASRPNATDGASNYAFADGSVRLLKYGGTFAPTFLWAVQPEWRTNGAVF